MFTCDLKGLKEQYDENDWQCDTIINGFSFVSDEVNFQFSPNVMVKVNLVTHKQTILKVLQLYVYMQDVL